MAKPRARISNSASSPAELKLRRIVALLARAEARDWLNGRLPVSPAAAGEAASPHTHAHKEDIDADR
jgi:hypothetical protein